MNAARIGEEEEEGEEDADGGERGGGMSEVGVCV